MLKWVPTRIDFICWKFPQKSKIKRLKICSHNIPLNLEIILKILSNINFKCCLSFCEGESQIMIDRVYSTFAAWLQIPKKSKSSHPDAVSRGILMVSFSPSPKPMLNSPVESNFLSINFVVFSNAVLFVQELIMMINLSPLRITCHRLPTPKDMFCVCLEKHQFELIEPRS